MTDRLGHAQRPEQPKHRPHAALRLADTVPGGWRDTAFLAAVVVDLGLVVLAGLGIAAAGRRWRRG